MAARTEVTSANGGDAAVLALLPIKFAEVPRPIVRKADDVGGKKCWAAMI